MHGVLAHSLDEGLLVLSVACEVEGQLARHDPAEFRVVAELALLLLLERRRGVREPRLARALVHSRLHRRELLFVKPRTRGHEHEVADAVRVLGGVQQRDEAAVRVAEQVDPVHAEVLLDVAEIGDVVGERVGVLRLRRI